MLDEHGLKRIKQIEKLADLRKLDKGEAASAVLSLEAGFETGDLVIIGEQDILGDRMVRRSKRRKRGADFISEVAGLDEGSLVVHAEHGIGRFVGLITIEAAVLREHALSFTMPIRPSSSSRSKILTSCRVMDLTLRKPSSISWGWRVQAARKAKLKKRLLDMADALIKLAATRITRRAPVLETPEGLYDEFAARFLTMRRKIRRMPSIPCGGSGCRSPDGSLVCGDVGFGKTEVALRAAFSPP